MPLSPEIIHAIEQSSGLTAMHAAALAPYTHFKIGGPCAALFTPSTMAQAALLLQAAREQSVPVVVLGGGTNVLVSDAGIDGVVMRMAMRDVQVNADTGRVIAGAGALSSALARRTAEAGLTGFEWAVTLPGTIGGAVVGNAGCFGGEVKDNFVEAVVFDNAIGDTRTVTKQGMAFAYRESAAKRNPWVVLQATFAFQKSDPTLCLARLEDALQKRLVSQPKNERCAGCAFKNVEQVSDEAFARLEKRLPNIPPAFRASRTVAAGWLIDKLDLKGLRIGDAAISQVHGNFLVNMGEATADQVSQLLAVVSTRVRNETGLELHEELRRLG